MNKSGSVAVGLYAVLARDACDFIDMINETEDEETLITLYHMLTFKKDSLSKSDVELNRIGAYIVGRVLYRRGIKRPDPLEKPKEPVTIPFGDI